MLASLAHFYSREIVDRGKEPELLFLAAFLATFGVVRAITHAIRAQRFRWLRNVELGKTHVHHLVPGILLLITSGYLALAFGFYPSRGLLAVLFGIGVGLTLDEFALWLHLRDVYWRPEGRRSVDAVAAASVFFALLLLGVNFWIELARAVSFVGDEVLAFAATFALALAAVCFLKGKLVTGVATLFFPALGLVGAVRPAKTNSPWARATEWRRASLGR